MSDPPGDGEQLPCPTLLYRSLFNRWIEQDGEVSPEAYMLIPENADGLSMWLDPANAWRILRRVRGVHSLHCGRVRDLAILVRPDGADHALVVGVPRHWEG